MGINAYDDSVILKKILKRKKTNKPLRIAFLDIDSTMTGSYKTTNQTRKLLERLGYAIVYVTARTEEMLMSSNQYQLSKQFGFDRAEPLLGRKSGLHTYLPPEKVEPLGLLDPEVIAGSSGTQILLKQKQGGYRSDSAFEQALIDTSESWRNRYLSLIETFNTPVKRAFLEPYEYPENYYKGISNVYQPKYRIAVSFQSAKQKNAFRSFLHRTQKTDKSYDNVTITDDSEPVKELYVLYLTPKNCSKRKAADHIISMITRIAHVKRSELQVLIAGDGHADFEMGVRAAPGTNVTFILAGGSRLTHALTCEEQHPDIFDEELEKLKALLSESDTKGYYHNQLYDERNLIICDQVYKGKKEVESIFSLIEEIEFSTDM